MAVLGLVDYQTLQRQDWKTNIASYQNDFVLVTKQLATYFNDRIRYWEVWNEPNYTPTGITPNSYAALLTAAYDAIKTIDSNDKVLFAGLAQTGQTKAGNSYDYITDVSTALGNRNNPAPYDIFNLHPYLSDEYEDNHGVVIDPARYLHWSEPPLSLATTTSPTTIHKFFVKMEANGRKNQPIWITEIGWNRAAGSHNPATLACGAINSTMVSGVQQALYALRSFDILFQETGWNANTPSVTKIFWYQYMDVGRPQNICNTTAATVSPSWGGSYLVQGASQAEAQVDWWFGLYQGILRTVDAKDVTHSTIATNPVQCIFSGYPFASSGPLSITKCLGFVYLPLIQTNPVTASGQ